MSSFPELKKQSRALRILSSFLKAGYIPQALLFEGEAGLGKRASAEYLAQALLCENPKEKGASCGGCRSCKKMTAHQHPDVITVEPDGSTIKIEQIRSLQEKIRFRPVEGPLKFILIDPADKMNAAAANSLLKTLEEPPDYVRLLLISSKALSLLPTIRSRCQSVPFSPLSQRQIINLLIQKNGCSIEEAARIAVACNLQVAQCLTCDPEQAAETENTLHALVSGGDPFEHSASFSSDGAALEQALCYLTLWFRDVIVYQRLNLHPPIDPKSLLFYWRIQSLEEWAQKMNSYEVIQFLSDVQKVSLGQNRNLNRQLSLESLLLHLSRNSSAPAAR